MCFQALYHSLEVLLAFSRSHCASRPSLTRYEKHESRQVFITVGFMTLTFLQATDVLLQMSSFFSLEIDCAPVNCFTLAMAAPAPETIYDPEVVAAAWPGTNPA